MFQKTSYYPVCIDTKEIIDMPFRLERNFFIMFRGTNFVGIKGRKLNEHRCYDEFTITKPKRIKE